MIDKAKLRQTVDEAMERHRPILVDIVVSPGNDITVEVDSASGVDIDSCAAITRAIESVFDREVEDYSLEGWFRRPDIADASMRPV